MTIDEVRRLARELETREREYEAIMEMLNRAKAALQSAKIDVKHWTDSAEARADLIRIAKEALQDAIRAAAAESLASEAPAV